MSSIRNNSPLILLSPYVFFRIPLISVNCSMLLNSIKLSISSFLESSGLDSNKNYFRQKVSKIGNETRPSTRNGTTGKSLRQSISNLRSREIFNIVRSVRDSHFDNAIADWRMDHLQYLHKNSIRNLSVRTDTENAQKKNVDIKCS